MRQAPVLAAVWQLKHSWKGFFDPYLLKRLYSQPWFQPSFGGLLLNHHLLEGRWFNESFAPILLPTPKQSGFPLTLSIFRGSFVEPASTRWRFSESFAPILPPAPKHQGFPWLYPSFGGLNQLLLNLHLLDEGSMSLLLLFYYQLQSSQGFPWLYPSFGGLLLNLHLLDEGSVSLSLLFYHQLQSIRVSPDFIHLSGVICWTCIY